MRIAIAQSRPKKIRMIGACAIRYFNTITVLLYCVQRY